MKLEEIIDLDNILIYSQALVDLKKYNNKPNYEILSRFQDKNKNMVYPNEVFTKDRTNEDLFILDKKIFSESFKILNKTMTSSNYSVAINISEISIDVKRGFIKYIEELRKENNLNSNNITLELTERSIDGISEFINQAIDLNYNIGIDDFGTENFPIHKLIGEVLEKIPPKKLHKVKVKLDQIFFMEYLNKYPDITDNFISMITSTRKYFPGFKIVGEGIENEKILNYLLKKDIDYGQGFYWSKPKLLTKNYIQPKLYNK